LSKRKTEGSAIGKVAPKIFQKDFKDKIGKRPKTIAEPKPEMPELTFEEALNKRDIQQIDAAVSAATAKRQKPNESEDTEIETGSVKARVQRPVSAEAQSAENKQAQPKAWFDQEEADSEFEEEPSEDEVQIPEELLCTEVQGTTRRRLRCKTAAAADHGYTARPLQNLQEHRVHMHKFKRRSKGIELS